MIDMFCGKAAHRLIRHVIFVMIAGPAALQAQHNGDPLFFQGLADRSPVSVKGSAYGNAFASRSNDLDALFYNPAGLADLQSIRVSVASHYASGLTRDNENFYPGSGYVGTSLYLERLLIPDPAWNNLWDDSLRTIVYDSLGNPIGTNWWDPAKLRHPVQGADDYSAEAADHEQSFDTFAFDHIAVAVPFDLLERRFVAALSYSRQYDAYNYDWNGAYLNPHWGSSDIIQDTTGAIVRSDWSVSTRQRTGGLYALTGALALQLDDHFMFGAKLNWVSGTTTDQQVLDRIGYFRFKHGANQSRWSFSYDANRRHTEGTSTFSALDFSLGALYRSANLNLGINVQLPFTIRREWSYTTQVTDTAGTTTSAASGVDRAHMPAVYTAGVTIMPNRDLTLSFSYEYNALSTTSYDVSPGTVDSLSPYQRWVDQIALRFGVEYSILEGVKVLAGYQSQGAPFIGYGVAVRDAGAPGESYSVGLSVDVPFGCVTVAYTFSRLKYYDVYMTNRNFTLEQLHRLQLGYTLTL